MKASLSYAPVLLALSGLMRAAPAPSTTTTAAGANPTVCTQVVQSGPPIVASNPAGLELTGGAGGHAILQQAGLTIGWNFSNGGLGAPQYCTDQWLNIVPGPHPWKRLVWGSNQVTTTWKAGYDSDLTAKKTLTYNETSTFLACNPTYESFALEMIVFLLTDADAVLPVLADETLSNVDITSYDDSQSFRRTKVATIQYMNICQSFSLNERAAAMALGPTSRQSNLVIATHHIFSSIMKVSLSYLPILLAFSGLMGAAPAPSTTTATETAETVCMGQSGPPIAPNASNLQLTGGAGGQAILQQTGLTIGWNFTNGGLGAPQICTGQWLNIVPGAHPWKKLVWGSSQDTTTWKAGYDSNLAAKKTLTYNGTSTFLACNPNCETFAAEMIVFLLTDDDFVPLAADDTLSNVDITSCRKTKLHIGSNDESIIL
ncbi:hypothetical protein FRC01_011769 [Tulasnella sp. 417]|nr:hypothetical protein FRC01_011769 [Tulasnella sp. 417]